MSYYDVIIIGSGAGGGTLARHLAPSGKRILLLERGDWLPREPQNWSAADVFVENRYISPGHLVRRRRQALPAAGALLRGRRDEALRRGAVPDAREDFGELRHHGGISPAWPISYEEMEPYYTQGRAALRGPRRARRGPNRTAGQRALPVPRRLARAAHPAALRRLRRRRPAPVSRALRRDARRGEHALQRCVRCSTCDGFPCLVHAKSDAEVLGVRPALEHENVTLLTNAPPCSCSTNPAGTAVTEVVVERDGARETYSRRHRRRLLPARRTPPSCCSARPATSTPTALPTAPTRSGATTCSTTARPCSRSPRSPTRRSSRRRSASTTSTSRATPGSSRWATSRWSASRSRRCTAARSR